MFRLLAAASAALLVAMVTGQAYQLSGGAEDIVPNLVETFSCDGRPFGYYADVANDCQVFHVCVPTTDEAGEVIQTEQFSFLCGNETIFDQATLTCNYPVDALPCEDAESAFSLKNEQFFRIADDA